MPDSPTAWPEARKRLEADAAETRGQPPHKVWKYVLVRYDDLMAALQTITALEAERDRVVEGAEVDFYEREFYPLSNFSAFHVRWAGHYEFDTSEALYHWLKFSTGDRLTNPSSAKIAMAIMKATSAHDAFKIAEANKQFRRGDWNDVKVGFMREIIRTKTNQHEYVRRKLLETGDRPLVEGSWRDDFWGIGPNRDGQNMLGKLWMKLRGELLALASLGEGGA